ncbi:MAG: hypothetical protein ACLFTH_00550 [Candidatus Woesearchaeota archaeon]
MAMNKKPISVFALVLLLFSLVTVGSVAAQDQVDLEVEYLRIDGEMHDPYDETDQVLEVDRGQKLPIKVKLEALSDVEDVQVSAKIAGYEYSQYEQDKIFQMSDTFDLKEGRVDYEELELEVPVKIDTDDIKLRIYVENKNGNTYVKEYNLDIVGVEEEGAVMIKETSLSPSDTVMAGRALSGLVVVENVGRKDLDDVTLIASVPALGIRDAETLDEFEVDDVEAFEKILLRFPDDAKPDEYRVDYTVKFDEYESTTVSDMVTVTESDDDEDEDEEGKTTVSVPSSRDVVRGQTGAVYPVTISNSGSSAKTFDLSVSDVDKWGSVNIDPSETLVAQPGESATAYLYVSADEEAELGDKSFTLTVSGDDEQKTIPLSALVTGDDASSWDGVTRALEIGLIVLVIILILIGLIVGFNKLRGSRDDEDDDAKTYY